LIALVLTTKQQQRRNTLNTKTNPNTNKLDLVKNTQNLNLKQNIQEFLYGIR